MEVAPSARKHEVEDADVQHAWRNAMRLVEYDYLGEDRFLSSALSVTAGCWSWSSCPFNHRGASSTPTDYDQSSTTT